MSRQEVIDNIMVKYGDYGMAEDVLEEMISSGEREGFTYRMIYNGIRMMLGDQSGREELFSAADMAEMLGISEGEAIQQIEEMRVEIEAAGENPDDYFRKCEPVQRFVLPPTKYLS